MKQKTKINFKLTLSWSTVAFLALLMVALKSCTPAHAVELSADDIFYSRDVSPKAVSDSLIILVPNQPQGVSAAVARTIVPPASSQGNEGHDNRAALNFLDHGNLQFLTEPTGAEKFWLNYYLTNHATNATNQKP